MSRSGSTNRYHHGDLRRALVTASRKLLEKEGPAGLTLRAAARAVGVTSAAPYAHFKDKNTLLAALAEEGFAEFTAALREATPARSGAQARLRGLARAYVAFAQRHPALFRLMFGAELADLAPYPALREKAVESYEVMRDAVDAALPKGPNRPAAVEEAATAAWSLAHGLAILLLDGKVATGAGEQEIVRRIDAAASYLARGFEKE